jgi:hypothetical protein
LSYVWGLTFAYSIEFPPKYVEYSCQKSDPHKKVKENYL